MWGLKRPREGSSTMENDYGGTMRHASFAWTELLIFTFPQSACDI